MCGNPHRGKAKSLTQRTQEEHTEVHRVELGSVGDFVLC
jgi:hypothetical protein